MIARKSIGDPIPAASGTGPTSFDQAWLQRGGGAVGATAETHKYQAFKCT